MPFRKNNKYRLNPSNEVAFDKSPLCFRVREGVKEKLKTVPGWQERLRNFVDEMVEEVGDSCR
jgi:hypothetical protein